MSIIEACPYTPQQNGLAERKHRHIVETGLSLLSQSGLPAAFWDDSFVTAVYLINRIPSQTLSFASPYEILYKSKPNYLALKPFGCLCYPHIRHLTKSKLEFRSYSATFLGYSPSHKGYKAMLTSGKIIITRDIVFHETVFPHKATSQSPSSVSFDSPHTSSSITPFFSPPPAPTIISSPPSPSLITPSSPLHHHTPSSPNLPTDHAPISAPSESPSGTSDSTLSPAHDSPAVISNRHHMVTRAKHGIFKPKALAIAASSSDAKDDLHLIIPCSAKFALAIPVWRCVL